METLFAEIKDGKVLRVIVVDPKDVLDETTGVAFCKRLLGGNWKQTYPDGSIRKHYAGIDYTFDTKKDAFIAPQFYPSWSLDEDCNWKAPVAMPKDDKFYTWDEDKLEWTSTELEK